MHGAEALAIVTSDMSMRETLLKMSEKGFGLACMVDDAVRLSGVISDGDLRRNIDHLAERSAGDVASRAPKTVTSDLMVAKALAVMNNNKVNALVVVGETGIPVGLLRIHDCLKAGVA